LIVRAAPTEATRLELEADPGVSQTVELLPKDGWLEQRIDLGTPGVSKLSVRIDSRTTERVLFHVWAVQALPAE
jgi:hypothetical protein